MNYDFANSPDIHKYIDTLNWIDASLAELADSVSKDEYDMPIICAPSTANPNCLKIFLSNNERNEKYLLSYLKNKQAVIVFDENNNKKYSFFYSTKEQYCFKLIYDAAAEVSLTCPSIEEYNATEFNYNKSVVSFDKSKLLYSLSVPLFPNKNSTPELVDFTASKLKSYPNIVYSLDVPLNLFDTNNPNSNQCLHNSDGKLFVTLASTFIHTSIIQSMETLKKHILKKREGLNTSTPSLNLSDDEELSL